MPNFYFPRSARKIMAAGAIATLMVGAASIGFNAPLALSYNLVALSDHGDVYVLDHDLTLRDCVDAWHNYPPELTLSCDRTFGR